MDLIHSVHKPSFLILRGHLYITQGCFEAFLNHPPTYAQCLNLLGMGRKKSEFFKNGVKPLLWTLLGTHNSNLLFGPIFGPILGHFWAQKAKNRPKNQNSSFSVIFRVEIFFEHNFLNFIFLNGNHIYPWIFFIKKCFIKKYFPIFFFKNFPLVPPMDVFSSFGGPRVVSSDLSCSRVAAVHCAFQGDTG